MNSLNEWLRLIEQQTRDEAAATWLVLADWLEERGDRRNELVRLLHQPGYTPTLEERNTRLRTLLDEVPPLWENTLGMHFVWVPSGTFWMGGGGGKCGKNQVRIEQGFALGMFAVTQGQWQAVIGNNPSCFSRSGEGREYVANIDEEELKQFPVETVSCDDVQAFIVKLNETERESGYLYRLPTEEEWEYACRGGPSSGNDMTKKECSFHYYFDNGPTNTLSTTQANVNSDSPYRRARKGTVFERTTKGGSYRPNRLGLYDMHGNVWEWTSSQVEATLCVIRGGGFNEYGKYCRASFHNWSRQDLRRSFIGFRLVCSPSRKQ